MGRCDRTHFKDDKIEMQKALPIARELGLDPNVLASQYFYAEALSLPDHLHQTNNSPGVNSHQKPLSGELIRYPIHHYRCPGIFSFSPQNSPVE